MAVDAAVLGFLATYVIHSTLLLALAWTVSRAIPASALALRGLVWRVAIFGGLATAVAQVATGYRTPFAHWSLVCGPVDDCGAAESEPFVAEPVAAPTFAASSPVSVVAALAIESAMRDGAGELAGPAEHAAPVAEHRTDALGGAARDSATGQDDTAPVWIASAWSERGPIAFALVLAAVASAFAAMALRLARRLRGALAIESGPMREAVDALAPSAFGRSRRVRLLAAPRVATPLSFGFVRPTICVPPRALDELTGDEQRALVAHELAHLARRDPAWLSAAWLVEHAFFFQPLNRLARRELHDVAELACDAWAARRTGQQLALASCLARIATWIVEPRPALPATSMAGAGGRSRLARRVERLLDDAPMASEERARPVARLAALAAVTAVVLAAPGVSARPSSRSAPAATGVAASEVGHHPSLAFDDAAREPVAPSPEPVARGARGTPDDLATALGELRDAIDAVQREAADLRRESAGLAADAESAVELSAIERRIARVERRCARLAQIAASLQESPRAAALAEWLSRTGP